MNPKICDDERSSCVRVGDNVLVQQELSKLENKRGRRACQQYEELWSILNPYSMHPHLWCSLTFT